MDQHELVFNAMQFCFGQKYVDIQYLNWMFAIIVFPQIRNKVFKVREVS